MTEKKIDSAQSSKPRIWKLRDISDVKTVKFVFHFGFVGRNELGREFVIPPKIPRKPQGPLDYTAHRTDEVMRKGGGADFEKLTEQRPGIMDTGKERTPDKGLNWCKGASTIFKKLLDDNWKITDLQWIKGVTQQRLATGYGLPEKDKVIIEVSKNSSEELKLEKDTMTVIWRDLGLIWQYFHEWDNSHNEEITLSFTGMHKVKYHSLGWIIALPRKPST